MLRRLTRDDHVFVTDVTARYSQINVQGPRSRELLQRLTSHDLNDRVFPFRQAANIEMGMARVLVVRITYVGELGYELFVPVEQARGVFDSIAEIGAAFDLQYAGLKALGSLRIVSMCIQYGPRTLNIVIANVCTLLTHCN
jgi:glycine cleavage system aminomethyltransferase T